MNDSEFYQAILEEYRFQINLNWNRNKFYLTLNVTLIVVACGLLRIPAFQFAEILTMPLLILGFLFATIGLLTLLKGIEYRRRIFLKKAELENRLDIEGVNTTAGMRESKMSWVDKERWVKRTPRIGSISFYLAGLYLVIAVINISAFVCAIAEKFNE